MNIQSMGMNIVIVKSVDIIKGVLIVHYMEQICAHQLTRKEKLWKLKTINIKYVKDGMEKQGRTKFVSLLFYLYL